MRILAFGGLGFIGGNFVRWANDAGKDYEIRIADAGTYAADRDRLPSSFSGEIRIVNLENSDLYMDLVDWCDVVINFAAETHNDRSLKDPAIFIRSNVLGAGELFNACTKLNKPVIQISTDEVYGDFDFGTSTLATEKSKLFPSSPYSSSKAAAELLAMSWMRSFGLEVTVTNCSNNFGPKQNPEKLIPNVVQKVSRGESIKIYGSGQNVRDWIHVDDHSNALSLILEQRLWGQKFNISANNEWTNVNLVHRILAELGVPDHPIEYIEDRWGHDRRYGIDATKIRGIGWKPIVTFDAKFTSAH